MNKTIFGHWISTPTSYKNTAGIFSKTLKMSKPVENAILRIAAKGMYHPYFNGTRITDAVFLPGWTSYHKQLQYQEFDVKSLLKADNTMEIMLGKGWYGSSLAWDELHVYGETAISVCLEITYQDGSYENILSGIDWEVRKSGVLDSEIYHGEIFDASAPQGEVQNTIIHPENYNGLLIPQEGEYIKEHEHLPVNKIIITPKGETVLDFGQILTGYVKVKVKGKKGSPAVLRHGEVLDINGNFYTENLRDAKQENTIICSGESIHYKPYFTFQGFRYVSLVNWPEEVKAENFTAIAVYSDMERTGNFSCSEPKINKLYENIIWGLRGNFLDVPTDCPQRNERLGWTGDAQVFIRAAAYNYKVDKFFTKWLHSLRADQFPDGGVPSVIPNVLGNVGANSAAWGDAAVICPWQLYLSYGDKQILTEQFESMKGWVDYMRGQGLQEEIWDTGEHYGDWLGLDAPYGSYKGATSETLIATAFYAYSTSLLVKAGKVVGKDISNYSELYHRIRTAYIHKFLPEGDLLCQTQTAHVLTLYFDLCDNKQKIADNLADLIRANGSKLQTGFVGTPYLLHALSDNGYSDLAYDLLLQEEFPSWLFAVNQGATTIWEHWDSLRPDGSMWSPDMNSFNHYAYGAVADWMFGVSAGICTCETQPGYKHIVFKPIVSNRMSHVEASLNTKYGRIASSWKREEDNVIFSFMVPENCTAEAIINGKKIELKPGENNYRQP